MSTPSDEGRAREAGNVRPPERKSEEVVWGDARPEEDSGQDAAPPAGECADDDADEVVWREKPLKPIKPNAPRTVGAGFSEFCERLVPKYTESEAAVLTLQTIEKCLSKTFDLSFMAPYGSRGHGTNVQGYSAIDNFAVVPSEQLFENSDKSLQKVHDTISASFPDSFITEGRPVVAVPFGERRSERHHIVPAYYVGSRGEHDVFAIPAPRERWVKICPAAHSIWINELDRTLNKNLKSFIRVVKAWSYYNDDIVWRHYLELCVADFLKHDSKIVYSRDLSSFFGYLAERELAPFEETAGCSEPVYGTTIADRDAAMAVIHTAHRMARKAWACEQKGNIPDAFYWWRKIFDWRFAAF